MGDALVQSRRKRIWKSGFAVFHPVAHRCGIFLSGSGVGPALDGTEEVGTFAKSLTALTNELERLVR